MYFETCHVSFNNKSLAFYQVVFPEKQNLGKGLTCDIWFRNVIPGSRAEGWRNTALWGRLWKSDVARWLPLGDYIPEGAGSIVGQIVQGRGEKTCVLSPTSKWPHVMLDIHSFAARLAPGNCCGFVCHAINRETLGTHMGRTHTSQTEAGVKLLVVTIERGGSRVEGTSALLSRTMSVPVNPCAI